ncbi:MAG: TATA-box-binding protein [Nitrososphaerales archaeon]
MPQVKTIIGIENVVATATIKEELNLNKLINCIPEINYEPRRFPGLIIKLKKPKMTALIFPSGRLVCTGARSEEQVHKAVKILMQRLKDVVNIESEPEIKIQNIVGAAYLGGRVKIEDAAKILKRSFYEPEQFPGLIYRMDDPQTVFIIFASGKLVCTGAKKEVEVYKAINKLHNILEEKGLMIY